MPMGLKELLAAARSKRDDANALTTLGTALTERGEYRRAVAGPLAMALLDRLVEKAIILKIKGKTYRTPLAKGDDNHD